ncbi:hypothetical protein TrVE_jg9918 [Triparma verrucosa]|uniref:deoxyribose-phosphate aldolase n=1 Tax=Triparma verrucosa TaxID=1606542 RepID=A0A9W7CHB9_9STRA|nr:hypothetical protein TrVE_jg9918 [Triparma verrucosa]
MDVSQLISSVHSKLLSFSLLNHKTLPTPLPPPTFPSKVSTLIDHTLLSVPTTAEDIQRICEEALLHSFKSVCIPPSHVPLASKLLSHSSVLTCTVISFPNGYSTSSVKASETSLSIKNSAEEIDMVTNVSYLKSLSVCLERDDREGAKVYRDKYVEDVMRVCEAAEGVTVKCIIEIGALTDEEIAIASFLFRECIYQNVQNNQPTHGPHYIKTSTGFNGYAGATTNAVRIMADVVRECGGKVKASGGVGTLEQARKIVEAGAERIGASKGVKIVEGGEGGEGGY